eukprot:689861-Amphidinium_carterae.1
MFFVPASRGARRAAGLSPTLSLTRIVPIVTFRSSGSVLCARESRCPACGRAVSTLTLTRIVLSRISVVRFSSVVHQGRAGPNDKL